MRKILSINEDWKFYKNCEDINASCGGKSVDLPHTWNALDGQDGGNDYFRGKCVYKKTLKLSDLPKNDKHYLEIDGANSICEVYINGSKVTRHEGGYSRFRCELTEFLSRKNEIAIVVDNSKSERVYPEMADFTFYGGLYRDVSIVSVPNTHFELTYFGTPAIKVTPTVTGNDASVKIETYVLGIEDGDMISFEILDGDGSLVVESTRAATDCELTIENVRLWNGKKDPYLYTAKASIIRGGEALDCVSARFGCRTFRVDVNGGFILNGKSYALRGVSRHQDRAGIGNALKKEHHDEDMQLILELGATSVRLAHYQHSQYFYDLCDENGIIVWAEIPYISKHLKDGDENTVSQLTELIVQNYNHPSIVIWGISNEITLGGKGSECFENHKRLNELAHTLDSTRLTAIACVSMCDIDEPYVHITDLVAYNHYFGWYGGDTDMNGPWFDNFHAKYPGKAIGVSEYGCEGLDYHSSSPVQGDYTEEYQAHYHEELIKQLYTRKYLFATYVWNMFDFGSDSRAEGGENGINHKGLVTFDRKYKKDAFYAYKAWLSDEPFVYIAGKRYRDRVEDKTKITVYSNCDEVELFANGKSVAKKISQNRFFYFEVDNVGSTILLAKSGKYTDTSEIRRVDTLPESYILREKNAVLNWFDIEAPEGRFSLNDKISDIINNEKGKVWFANILKKLKISHENEKINAFNFAESDDALRMLGGFTVLRLCGMLGMMDISFTRDELLSLNRDLNEISK